MRNEALVIGITRSGQRGTSKKAGTRQPSRIFHGRAACALFSVPLQSRSFSFSSPCRRVWPDSPLSVAPASSHFTYTSPVGNSRDFGDHAARPHFAGPSAAVALAIRHHCPSLVARIRARLRAGAPSLALAHLELGHDGRARRLLADSGTSQFYSLPRSRDASRF